MVRVGGGWDTLQHYLYKHDHCRQKNTPNNIKTKVAHEANKNEQLLICFLNFFFDRKMTKYPTILQVIYCYSDS